MIILILFISRTSPKQTNHKDKTVVVSTDAFGSFLRKLCYWEINENDCKVASKSYCCLAGTRTFPGSHLSKNYGNGNTADNFVSPYTVDFKMQTSHTVRLEITATPQAGIFSPQHRIKKCATPQHRKSPMSPSVLRFFFGLKKLIVYLTTNTFTGLIVNNAIPISLTLDFLVLKITRNKIRFLTISLIQ